ncbi:prolyl oligopeptidase family serine peptidase [Alicyclobacillus ferrooxydans]|uniref:prolyl oligopeptidase n=1 Tax=Alicyclobacillus ferrooxydans TaxID=471514 RepID=A0A0P9GWF6_9BACL|nr:prolyl oligopeptidase family serine peptidase [Alicyclobacillus ferrooxydans]KPV45635.1 hypothetical protein AN477_01595 [Alicyclobacillus ferrooxydans]
MNFVANKEKLLDWAKEHLPGINSSWIVTHQQQASMYYAESDKRDEIVGAIESLLSTKKCSVPARIGSSLYYQFHTALDNHPSIKKYNIISGESCVIVDPRVWDGGDNATLHDYKVSPDELYISYAVFYGGNDLTSIRIKNITTGEYLPYELIGNEDTQIEWLGDSSGFFYATRIEDRHLLIFHDISAHYSRIIWTAEFSEHAVVYPTISSDGKFLLIEAIFGVTESSELFICELPFTSSFRHLFKECNSYFRFIGNVENEFYFLTDFYHENGSIIGIGGVDSLDSIRMVVTGTGDLLETAVLINDIIACLYCHDAFHVLRLINIASGEQTEIELPDYGTLVDWSSFAEENVLYFAFSSFLNPTSVYVLHTNSCLVEPLWKGETIFDASKFAVDHVKVPSTNNVLIPMFIVHRKDYSNDKPQPTLLYGYGGFGDTITPTFSAFVSCWLECGGIYALANVRGGGEKGKAWHEEGRLRKKQNSITDFARAAKYLIDKGYTVPSKLAIQGESNGGLLVSACAVQNPHLFGAIVCKSPLTDMLSYHTYGIGDMWIPEYGDPNNSEDFEHLKTYSPLHNVRKLEKYPAMLIMADIGDSIVDASHAIRFAWTISNTNNPELLLRLTDTVGHGFNLPLQTLIDEWADIQTFLWNKLKT